MHIRNPQQKKLAGRVRRHLRVRAKVSGSAARPRLTVFRSAKHIRAQVIDDVARRTLASAIDTDLTEKGLKGKVAAAEAVGKLVAERAKAAGVSSVVFDRGGYAYHGRIKAVAEGARAGGLTF